MIIDDRKRVIGKIISVAADRFVVEMSAATDSFTVVGYDDIHYVAQLGSFVVIPVQSSYIVAEIIGLREKEAGGKEKTGDPELVKINSAKFLDLVPVGTLSGNQFTFGVSNFPSLYSDALYILDSELDKVFQVDAPIEKIPCRPEGHGDGTATRQNALTIGQSVVFQDYEVKVRVNEFFGGHVAVLGNTGSGKSCTVASILQSLFEKADEYAARGATFVLFDVNGEYSQAFQKFDDTAKINAKTLILDGSADDNRFKLPHWFLNFDEWELLLRASEKTQQPVLRLALGLAGLVSGNSEKETQIKEHFVAKCIFESFHGADGDSSVAQIRRANALLNKYGTTKLNQTTLTRYGCNARFGNFDVPANEGRFLEHIKSFIRDDVIIPPYKNTPFDFIDLQEYLDFAILYEEAHGNRQIRDYCSQMLTRLKVLTERESFEFLRHSTKEVCSQKTFLMDVLGLQDNASRISKEAQIVIIDLNGVEDEVVELTTAVLTRMIFDLLKRAEDRNTFPINLVLEEAHRYIAERASAHSVDATKIFERVAKEGRKYGMFLTVASQRPSELSKTVLSQCSNFVVHRIQNPDDLSHIRQMTPYISDNVLRRLPSLPKQHALIFGNSVNIPTTFKVRNVDPEPKSADAKLTDLWYRPLGTGVSFEVPVETVEASEMTLPEPSKSPSLASIAGLQFEADTDFNPNELNDEIPF